LRQEVNILASQDKTPFEGFFYELSHVHIYEPELSDGRFWLKGIR
jgi:hypothetical protein